MEGILTSSRVSIQQILKELDLLTDMVNGSSTELAIEFLGTQTAQIMYGEWPEMQDIVAGEGISFLNNNYLSSQ